MISHITRTSGVLVSALSNLVQCVQKHIFCTEKKSKCDCWAPAEGKTIGERLVPHIWPYEACTTFTTVYYSFWSLAIELCSSSWLLLQNKHHPEGVYSATTTRWMNIIPLITHTEKSAYALSLLQRTFYTWSNWINLLFCFVIELKKNIQLTGSKYMFCWSNLNNLLQIKWQFSILWKPSCYRPDVI